MTGSDLSPIERLLSDFSFYADRGDGAALAALFVPDGVLYVGGQKLEGREKIADDCNRRAQQLNRKTRHIWSNLRVEREDPSAVSTTAVQLTFEQRDTDTPTQLRVSDLFDELQKGADGVWRFTCRTINREMAFSI